MKAITQQAISVAFAITLTAITGGAHAALIDNGTTTLDTVSGKEWLDLDQSVNFSVNDILGGLGGFAAAGWAHATRSEIGTLMDAFSISTPNWDSGFQSNTVDLLPVATTQAIASLLSATYFASTVGIFDDGRLGAAGAQDIACINTTTIGCSHGGNSANAGLIGQTGLNADLRNAGIGHWLVRTSNQGQTPAPATLALIALGVAGLGFQRRKNSG